MFSKEDFLAAMKHLFPERPAESTWVFPVPNILLPPEQRRDFSDIPSEPCASLPPTPLVAAVHDGDFEAVRRLIAAGANPNELEPDWNCPPIMYAVLAGNLEIVRLLLECGADPNAVAGEPGRTILTSMPLMLAKQMVFLCKSQDHVPIVKLLERHGAIEDYDT
jgi:ankyrin repeat protein